MFGNYYAYDNPSALNLQLKEYLGSNNFEFKLGMFYSVYSLPNLVLPLFAGRLLDRFGNGFILIGFSVLTCLGQLIFAFGVESKHFSLMLIGRAIFGIGGESLSVAQTSLLTDWFKGKELGLALGLSSSVARLGTVANNFLSPHFATEYNVPFALWIGTLSCLISGLCSLASILIDKKFKRFISHSIAAIADFKRDSISFSSGFSLSFWILAGIVFMYNGTLISFNTVASDLLQKRFKGFTNQSAGRYMSIPDTLAIFLVPISGTLIDHYGYIGNLVVLGGLLCFMSHLLFITEISFWVPLMLMGIGYPLTNCTYLCVPLIISKRMWSAAYGLLSCSANLSYVVIPMLNAVLVTFDESYTSSEILFAFLAITGASLAFMLITIAKQVGIDLNATESTKFKKILSYDEEANDKWLQMNRLDIKSS